MDGARGGEGFSYRLDLPDADSAIAHLRDTSDPADLLVSDVVLPGSNGVELAEKLSALRPGLCVLFVSGFADEVFARQGINVNEINFLQKPYTITELAEAIRRTLDKAPTLATD